MPTNETITTTHTDASGARIEISGGPEDSTAWVTVGREHGEDVVVEVPTSMVPIPTSTPAPGIDKLAAALAKAQGMMKHAKKSATAVVKDSSGKFLYEYHYATLSDVWMACRDPLAKNGICVIQLPNPISVDDRAYVEVKTILAHSSGQQIQNTMRLPARAGKNGVGPQEFSSAISYAKRYALTSMVGIPSDDDDGVRASGELHLREAATESPATVDDLLPGEE